MVARNLTASEPVQGYMERIIHCDYRAFFKSFKTRNYDSLYLYLETFTEISQL
jgi:hypothetical protein